MDWASPLYIPLPNWTLPTLPRSQRTIPTSVLTPLPHLRHPNSRNFTCPCFWLLRCQRLNPATSPFSEPGRSFLQLRRHVVMFGLAPRPLLCLATEASLGSPRPTFLCPSVITRPYLEDTGLSLSHTPTQLCKLGSCRYSKPRLGHNPALLGSLASRSTHTSLTTTCSGSRSWGGGGRCLPPLSGMQRSLEAAQSLLTGVPHVSHWMQKMI